MGPETDKHLHAAKYLSRPIFKKIRHLGFDYISYLLDYELGWKIDVLCTICQAWGGGGGGGGGQHGAAAPGQEGEEQTRQRLAQNYHFQRFEQRIRRKQNEEHCKEKSNEQKDGHLLEEKWSQSAG